MLNGFRPALSFWYKHCFASLGLVGVFICCSNESESVMCLNGFFKRCLWVAWDLALNASRAEILLKQIPGKKCGSRGYAQGLPASVCTF